MFYTYILFSNSIQKYYVGYTSDLNDRLRRHGKDRKKFTGQCDDWKLVKFFEFDSKSDAMKH